MPDAPESAPSVPTTDLPQPTAPAQAAAASPRVIWTIVLSVAFLTFASLCGSVLIAVLKIDNQVLLVALTTQASSGSMGLLGMLVSLKQSPAK